MKSTLAAEVLEDGDHFHRPEAAGSTGQGLTAHTWIMRCWVGVQPEHGFCSVEDLLQKQQ